MTEQHHVTVDGNEAAARIAFLANELIALYPVPPSAPMGELADTWAYGDKKNVWGTVPRVIQMQGEGGVAGVLHGALQTGALATTFTASQGLLLMIPDMYRIAGELSPAVIHVAARAVATHASSVYADHSDVMAVRQTGWAMLAASTVQEAQDFALIAQAATFAARVPFVHFFDGFRTSHEICRIEPLDEEAIRNFLPAASIEAHRQRALCPDRPTIRGTGQHPDLFFQAREAANPFYAATPELVQETMDRFAERFGRAYRRFEYVGHPQAERVLVLMGSSIGAAEEAVRRLNDEGERVGLVKVRLYRPFDVQAFIDVLPAPVQRIAVLDRTKEPGSVGEPLYHDVLAAVSEGFRRADRQPLPLVTGGRYGLSSKEFTPAMAAAVLAEVGRESPRPHFTVGIVDDVTELSLSWDQEFCTEPDDVLRAVWFGRRNDGSGIAHRISLDIIGQHTSLYPQGYFVFESRQANPMTVTHMRFSPRPIQSSYLIDQADFVTCQDFSLLDRLDLLSLAQPGARLLLNCRFAPNELWAQLPREVQQQILDRNIKVFVIDANRLAEELGLGTNIGTIMQACFFWLSNVLPHAQAVEQIKHALHDTYVRRGRSVVDRHIKALDSALDNFHEIQIPAAADGQRRRATPVAETETDFVKRVTATLLQGQGDRLPVSAVPVDGTFPTGTARLEIGGAAAQIPIWEPGICTECGLCSLVCPHAAIRIKAYPSSAGEHRPATFRSKAASTEKLEGLELTVQVVPGACTGCAVCVDVCPAKDKESARQKAINMSPVEGCLDRERIHYDFFQTLPEIDRRNVVRETELGSQLLEPLFEFSSACAGCGETPYLKLLSQLFGDRALIANATGCSSIYGGHLPTTPWTTDRCGRGPAWAHSLFEDNAEFGLGMRLAVDQKFALVAKLMHDLGTELDEKLVQGLLTAPQGNEREIAEQRERVAQLVGRLAELEAPAAGQLRQLADVLVRRSVWIVGGDGWANDSGFGGLDHVLASGQDVNILVLDTGVGSSTGGQATKATPRSAVAKFAAAGKREGRKDLGRMALTYGTVYVAQVAMGANPEQTIRAFLDAESYGGPSLIIAYSHCIAHGVNMSTAMTHQRLVERSGFWPLYRFDPRRAAQDTTPLQLDSESPQAPFKAFAMTEARFAMLARTNPDHARELFELAQKDVKQAWNDYRRLADGTAES